MGTEKDFHCLIPTEGQTTELRCRVSILGIPKARKLALTLTSPDDPKAAGSARLTARPRAPSRPTPWCGLRLARPLGYGLRLVRPQGRGFRLVRRGPIPPPTTPGPSVWVWIKTLTSGKRLARLDVTHGHDRPYLRIHIKNSVGVPVLFCLTLVRTLTGASVHHDVRWDGMERLDRQDDVCAWRQ